MLSTRSLLGQKGTCPEEGTPIVGEFFFVTMTFPSGRRFAHYHVSESGAEADALEQRMSEAGVGSWEVSYFENSQYWSEIDPVYGSAAYVADEENIVAIEKKREEEAEWA